MSSPNQLSFLPDDYLDRKRRRRTVTICAVLFVLVTAGVLATLYLADRSLESARQSAAEVDERYAEAARRIGQVEQMQEKQRRMAQQAELTASLLEKVPRSYVLAEITNALPAGVSLLDFAMESKTRAQAPAPQTAFEKRKSELEAKRGGKIVAAPPAPRQYDVSLKLTGVAQTDVQVARFINRLSRSVLLADVNLIVSEEFVKDKDKVRRFQLEMKLNADAEVRTDPLERNKTATVELE